MAFARARGLFGKLTNCSVEQIIPQEYFGARRWTAKNMFSNQFRCFLVPHNLSPLWLHSLVGLPRLPRSDKCTFAVQRSDGSNRIEIIMSLPTESPKNAQNQKFFSLRCDHVQSPFLKMCAGKDSPSQFVSKLLKATSLGKKGPPVSCRCSSEMRKCYVGILLSHLR